MPPSALNQARDKYRNMKSGGGVLCISVLQLIVGLVLLGIYEGYKVRQAATSKRLVQRSNLVASNQNL